MNQQESAQNPGQLVRFLEERRNAANISGFVNGFIALGQGMGTGFLFYSAASLPNVEGLLYSLGGLSAIITSISGGNSVLGFFRGNLFYDRIAEIKQSSGYKAPDGIK